MARSCLHCGSAVNQSTAQFLCATCSNELFVCNSPACHTCGYPYFGELSGPRSCPHCAELSPQFDSGKTLLLAKGPARSLLHELKYRSGFYVLTDLEALIKSQKQFLEYIDGAHLIPVPLHKTKERERGFNQSHMIAKTLCQATNQRCKLTPHLIRKLFTQTQTRLNRNERYRNVKNAFALKADTVLIPSQQYILVDDVFTTGSTLNACATVLRNAGVRHLKIVTIGHG